MGYLLLIHLGIKLKVIKVIQDRMLNKVFQPGAHF